MTAINRYRSIWISDVHLGTKGCKAEFLLDFFRHNESEYLYLVGDIIDGWSLKRSWYWTQHHNDVIQKVLRKARKGTRVTYIPGNHDEFARAYVEHLFGGINVASRAIHTTSDGKRYLVLHGDEFDGIVTCAKWLAALAATPTNWRWCSTAGSTTSAAAWGIPTGRCRPTSSRRSRMR